VRVDDNMTRARPADREQALAGKQRRDAITQPNLDRAGCLFADHPGPDGRAFDRSDRNREQAVNATVGASCCRAIADQPLEHRAQPGKGDLAVRPAFRRHPLSLTPRPPRR
jgi:hypothetical protein